MRRGLCIVRTAGIGAASVPGPIRNDELPASIGSARCAEKLRSPPTSLRCVPPCTRITRGPAWPQRVTWIADWPKLPPSATSRAPPDREHE
jgi:hypothetical protein